MRLRCARESCALLQWSSRIAPELEVRCASLARREQSTRHRSFKFQSHLLRPPSTVPLLSERSFLRTHRYAHVSDVTYPHDTCVPVLIQFNPIRSDPELSSSPLPCTCECVSWCAFANQTEESKINGKFSLMKLIRKRNAPFLHPQSSRRTCLPVSDGWKSKQKFSHNP